LFFGLVFAAQNFVFVQAHSVQAHIDPITVTPQKINFGNVFPEEQLIKTFNVSLATDCQDKKDGSTINYSIEQKIKPKPGAKPPKDFQGTISDYCQTHPDDSIRCYPNLCPYLIKTSDSAGDTEASATISGSDKTDKWTILLNVPDILGSVGQDFIGKPVSAEGDYGCDIAINIKEGPKVYKISGKKFEDKDNDGQFDHNEQGLAGWTIYLDANNNNKLDNNEISVVTDKDGHYSFGNLPAGAYHVREVLKSGWKQTLPPGGRYDINLAGDVAGQDFGNTKLCKISGHEFEDKNGNGKQDRGEGDLAGWTIQLSGFNGSILTTKTDHDGQYNFDNLECGRYSMKEIPQSGWKQTTKDWPDVTIHSEDNDLGRDFGNRKR